MLKEDFEKLAEYGIEKNKTSVSLKKLISIIENNTEIKDRQKLIDSLKNEFEDRIINDIQKTGYTLKKLLKKENVKFIDKAENWKEAIFQSGDLLVSNKKVTSEYVQEMIEIVEEGIAMPHAGISENVLETGISLLVVNEKVSLPEGRNANIFLSFAAKNKNDNIDIMNDLFELITKYEFIDKVSKMKNYRQLETYLEEIIK